MRLATGPIQPPDDGFPVRGGGAIKAVPLTVSGLAQWFDAADPIGLYQDAAMTIPVSAVNDPVGGWRDRSGGGRHATQSTSGQRPQYRTAVANGLPGLQWDGVDDALLAPATASALLTAFVVATSPTIASGAKAMVATRQGNVVGGFESYAGPTSVSVNVFTGAAQPSAGTPFTAGTPFLAIITTDASTFSVEVNAGPATNTGTMAASTNNVSLGKAAPGSSSGASVWTGHLFEFLLYERVLTAGERSTIKTYLKAKWGLP